MIVRAHCREFGAFQLGKSTSPGESVEVEEQEGGGIYLNPFQWGSVSGMVRGVDYKADASSRSAEEHRRQPYLFLPESRSRAVASLKCCVIC